MACDIGETSLFVEASQEGEIALTIGETSSMDHAVDAYRTEEILHEGVFSLMGGTWLARCRSGQAVADRKSGCGCPVLATSFIEDVGEVIGNGFFGEA